MNLKSFFKQPESASRRVAKNTGILYVRTGITMFMSLYTTRLLLGALGASDFGIYGVVGSAIIMLGFLNDAMATATQRFISYAEGEGDKEKQTTIFNVSIILHFLIAIVMVVVLLAAGYFFFNGFLIVPEERIFAARMVYYFMIVSTVFGIMSVPYDAMIYAHENMLFYAIVGIVESILKLAVALAIVYTSADKLIVYGLLMACVFFIVMIIKCIYCRKNYKESVFAPRNYYKASIMKEMTGFAGWTLLGAASSLISNYGQGIVVNRFFGVVLNAAQGVATQVNGYLSILSNTVLRALNPVIMKSEGAGDRDLMFKAVNMGSKTLFLLMALLIIPISIEMPYLLDLWLGAGKTPDFAVIFCRLLLIKSLIDFLFIPAMIAIKAHGNIRKFETVLSILNLFPLFFAYYLFHNGFPAYTIYVIFIGIAVIELCVVLYFVWKNVGFHIVLFLKRVLLRCFIVFIIIFTVSFTPTLLWNDGFFRLVVITGISGITFLLASWYIGFNHDEKLLIKKLLTPFLSKIFPKK